MLQYPLEALNMVFPSERIDNGEDTDISELVGSGGLKRIMSFEETNVPPSKKKLCI